MEEKTFAVVSPIIDPSIKRERQILEWHGPLPPPCLRPALLSPKVLLSLSAALRATLLEILEEYLLIHPSSSASRGVLSSFYPSSFGARLPISKGSC